MTSANSTSSRRKARTITLKDNRFYADVSLGECEKFGLTGNTRNDKPFDLPGERK